ncbi:hypothetical protein WJX77_001530 [Trebouxia sp. C0004]
MARDYWSLLERKHTGTSLLLTGAAALTAGWTLCYLYQSQDAAPAEDNEEDQSQAETYSEQDSFSEPSTPRDVGISGRRPPRRTNTSQISFHSAAYSTADYKQAILIRTDLKMGTGKIAAQACHASVSAVKKSWRSKDPAYKAWESSSSVKICLGVDNVKELLTLREQARDAGLATAMVSDTEGGPPNRTVVAIGPGASSKIDAIIKQLKLYDQV